MYRTYAKYFKVYLFSRKNMIPKDYTIADMADDQAKVLKTLGISDACVMGVSQGGKIQVPTLIVGGERDYIVGNKAAYELAENISDCKLKIYEKYGHGAFEEAKDFNDLVLKFLV